MKKDKTKKALIPMNNSFPFEQKLRLDALIQHIEATSLMLWY